MNLWINLENFFEWVLLIDFALNCDRNQSKSHTFDQRLWLTRCGVLDYQALWREPIFEILLEVYIKLYTENQVKQTIFRTERNSEKEKKFPKLFSTTRFDSWFQTERVCRSQCGHTHGTSEQNAQNASTERLLAKIASVCQCVPVRLPVVPIQAALKHVDQLRVRIVAPIVC